MKPLKHWSISILIASALVLSAAKNASAVSKKPRGHEHKEHAEPSNKAIQDQQAQIPVVTLAELQSVEGALAEALAAIKQQAISAKEQAEADNETRDLAAASVVINGVLALIGFGYLIFMRLQWKEIGRQATIAENTLTEQSRPWVSADITILGDFIFTGDGASLYVSLKLKNSGNSVAKQVWPHLKLHAYHLSALNTQSEKSPAMAEFSQHNVRSARKPLVGTLLTALLDSYSFQTTREK